MKTKKRIRKTPWIDPNDLEDVEAMLPEIVRQPERWESTIYPFGDYFLIERLTCDLGLGECIFLTRFTRGTAGNTFGGSCLREPAFAERVLEGELEFGLRQPRRQKRGPYTYLHAAVCILRPGNVFAVRNANYVSWRVGTEPVLTTALVRDPYIRDYPSLVPEKFQELLAQFQKHYPI